MPRIEHKRLLSLRPVVDGLEKRTLLSIASQSSYVTGYSTVENSASNPAVDAVTPDYTHQVSQSAPNVAPITDGSNGNVTSSTPGTSAAYSLSLKSQVSAPGSDSGQVTISGSLNTSKSTYYQDSYFGGSYQVAGKASQAGTLTVTYNAGPSLPGNTVVANFYDSTYHYTSNTYSYNLAKGQSYSFLVTYSVEHGGQHFGAADSGVGVAASSTFTWELVPPHVSLAATIDSSLQGVHRLLYPGQNLAVPVIVTDTGNAAAVGNVNVNFYLSTDQQASVSSGDVPLNPDPNQALNIAAGKSGPISPTPHVTIPSTTKVGSYFIKAVISPGSKNPLSFTNAPLLTVSSALNEYDASPMYTGTPPVYEGAVTTVKASPNTVPTEFKSGFGDHQIQAYIQDNEGLSFTPYIDTQGIPTIGYGYNLQNADAAQRMAAIGLDYAKVLQQATLNNTTINASGGYNTTIKQKVTLAVAQGWFALDYPAAKNGLVPALATVGITAADFNGFSQSTQIVLIDMYYNMGNKYISGPAGKSFPKMLQFIKSGNLAAAGFELMDSSYDIQVKSRAENNFKLLVFGQAANL